MVPLTFVCPTFFPGSFWRRGFWSITIFWPKKSRINLFCYFFKNSRIFAENFKLRIFFIRFWKKCADVTVLHDGPAIELAVHVEKGIAPTTRRTCELPTGGSFLHHGSKVELVGSSVGSNGCVRSFFKAVAFLVLDHCPSKMR